MFPRAEESKIYFINSKQFNVTGLETQITNFSFVKLGHFISQHFS